MYTRRTTHTIDKAYQTKSKNKLLRKTDSTERIHDPQMK